MALTVKSLDDNGSVHGPEMLELTEDDIAVKFASGLSNLASFSLSISYPSIAAAPCMFNNAYKNVLALSLATDYTYKQAEKVKEFLKVSNNMNTTHLKCLQYIAPRTLFARMAMQLHKLDLSSLKLHQDILQPLILRFVNILLCLS